RTVTSPVPEALSTKHWIWSLTASTRKAENACAWVRNTLVSAAAFWEGVLKLREYDVPVTVSAASFGWKPGHRLKWLGSSGCDVQPAGKSVRRRLTRAAAALSARLSACLPSVARATLTVICRSAGVTADSFLQPPGAVLADVHGPGSSGKAETVNSVVSVIGQAI